MSEDELLAWVHDDYDRTLILSALEGTAFITRWRSAALMRQTSPLIDPARLPTNLSGLRQRGLIVSKMTYDHTKPRTIYRNGKSSTFAHRVRVWRQTPRGATIDRMLREARK